MRSGKKKLLFVGTALAATLSFPAAAMAQDGAAPASDIVVTGSRIVRDGYTAPTPVTVAPVEDLVRATPTNIPDALNKLPQFQNSSSPSRSSHNFSNSPDHGNILNLRGVGGNRTLILFDGMRVPPTTYVGTVDVSVIPSALVERVEVVTAGASAAYGSDAVTGVVNFVLDRDFEGLKGEAQGGVSERGDNGNYKASLAYGGRFAGGRGHVLLSGDFFKSNGMLRSDRPVALADYVYLGGVPGSSAVPGSAANPFRIYDTVRLAFASEEGMILGGPAAGQVIDPASGALRPFEHGAATGTGGFEVGGDGFTIPADVHAVAPLKTWQAFGRIGYELSPSVNAFVQGNFSRSELDYVSQTNAWTGVQNAPVFEGNPFIPASIAAALAADPTPDQQFEIGKYTAGNAKKPFTSERTDFWMLAAGLDGDLGDGWAWNASYNHGSSKHRVDQHNLYDYQRAYAALDAVVDPASGNIVCRPSLSSDPVVRDRFAGCQPLDIFRTGTAYTDQPGYDYAIGTMSYAATIRHDAFALSVQGSPLSLPAGPVDIVLGGEYRRQSLALVSNSDPALLDTAAERGEYFRGLRGVAPSSLFFWLTNVGVADGSVNVKEAFAEVNVPLLSGAPGFEDLSLNAAGRVTDYSTSGRVETWKVGLVWKPVDDLLLRGTVSRDIRAPTLFDLFAGDQSNIGLLNDPVTSISQNVPTVSGGNRDLRPERSRTLALGAVLTPSFLPGFSVSVDYFRLKITGAIGTLGSGQIVQNCYNDASAPECALISRPAPDAFPTLIRLVPANIAFLKTSGVDIDATYRQDIGPGQLSARLYASYLGSYVTRQSANQPAYEYVGFGNNGIGRPHWRGTFSLNYASRGGLNLFLSEQYLGSMRVGSPQPNQDYGGATIAPVWYTDLTVSQRIDAFGGSFEPFATINNLFDKTPPLVPGTIPGVNFPTIFSLYDTVGRTYTAGLRFRF